MTDIELALADAMPTGDTLRLSSRVDIQWNLADPPDPEPPTGPDAPTGPAPPGLDRLGGPNRLSGVDPPGDVDPPLADAA
ncbi:hypothetical protein [Gordonia sp. 852002-10350_SCH5691597]|uniref:hypothetical protein n=1 Tax=Gordonia sp. 852002-10350_SCH5691597 TaxID=1834085 RepID=UPI000AF5224F|nr:hypothetical protein [Gordonia sp. 852002-10350_SCH5691597]